MSPETPVLAVRAVSKSFGGVQALEDVTVDLYPGECLALMGGNGAGKSTLVGILSGLQAPDSGTIELGGNPVQFRSPEESRSAGVETVFQDLALCNNLDAVGNLFLGREEFRRVGPFKVLARRRMEKITREMLRALTVNLPDLHAPTQGLSGGQRQALAFARAIRARSRVLMLDEPTAALGVRERAGVIDTIKRIREEYGVSVLLVSHNLEEIRELADRAVVLRRGRVAGTLAVSGRNEHALVALLTGAAPGDVAPLAPGAP